MGSGIMGERLAAGNIAVALLANALATGAALVALILALGPISGAHFNPWVSLAAASQGDLEVGRRWCMRGRSDSQAHSLASVWRTPCSASPTYSWSEHVRTGLPQVASEAVATFGLLVIIACCRHRLAHAAVAVGAYIDGACWFTPSISFANLRGDTRARINQHLYRLPFARPTWRRFFSVKPWAPLPRSRAADGCCGCREMPRTAPRQTLDPSCRGCCCMETVIFACVHNAGRSQMAAAFFQQHLAAPVNGRTPSPAGTQPAARVHPSVVEADAKSRVSICLTLARSVSPRILRRRDRCW